ncbi:MliC family protein [Lacinutrix salivirga]
MTKTILPIVILSALFLIACKDTPKQSNTDTSITETVEMPKDNIIKTTVSNTEGKTLEMVFNNTKGTAVLNLNGESIELNSEKPASGIWYKNENYELRGKGNDIQLSKNGEVIFEHKDDIVKSNIKNKEGQTLDMTFNNTQGTVKVYLNGGEQIDLVAEKAASGIWYKNEDYELRGKGDNYQLIKNGKTVFKN